MRGGVDQPERRVRHRPRAVEPQPVVHLAQPVGPQVDVLALERADLLAGVVGQRLPVAVLDDDQRAVAQREVDVPVDQRRQRGPRVGRGLASARGRPRAAAR